MTNAVARSAQLFAVAGIPLAAGITGDAYTDPAVFEDGFHTALWIAASLAASGAVIAAVTLREPAAAETQRPEPAPARSNRHCALEAPPLSSCPGSSSRTTSGREAA